MDDLPALSLAGASADAAPTRATGAVLELQALALRHGRFEAAATAFVSELALRLGCSRVSLAARDPARPGRPARVLAFSHGADPDARRAATKHLVAAADEALDRGVPVELPAPPGGTLGAALAHAALLASTEAQALLSAPFEAEGAAPGVLILEGPQALDRAQRELALDAALFVGPVLMLMARVDAPWHERARSLLRSPFARDPDGGSPSTVVALAVATGVAVAVLWPADQNVVAQARIEGLGQRIVTAPADGFLQSVAVRPGEPVKAGQVMATLDDREPARELERAAAEHAQLDRQYRDAMARDDAGQIVVARAKLEQALAQHALAQRRLERMRLTAPFDGVVIGGDLASSLGMPVRRGQELMVVAPASGWRVVAQVDEHDITDVRQGAKARMLVAALAGTTIEFDVARISPVAIQAEGRNVFEAEGPIAADAPGLRPGLHGVVRIEAGERSAAAVWWTRGMHWLRRIWWMVLA